jgi:hypothetical protein
MDKFIVDFDDLLLLYSVLGFLLPVAGGTKLTEKQYIRLSGIT